MKVWVKELQVDMEIKNKGMELAVHDTSGKQIGDLVVTKTGLTWCKGKQRRENGTKISWTKFVDWVENQ